MLGKLGNILCVCTYVCMSVYLYIWGYGGIHVCVYTHVCAVSLCMCSRVCIYCYECVYICVDTCVYEYVCIQIVYVSILMYVWICICICAYTCVYEYIYRCVCISMHMYLFTYRCLYLYICIYVCIIHCVSIGVYILAVKNLDNRTAKSWVQDSPIIIVWPWGNFLTSFSFNHFIFRLEIRTHASEIVLRGI